MIEVRDITKSFGDRRVVDGLSFQVRPGLVTGFLGPNGSGKSTTMRIIMGLTRPERGSVRVDGRPLREHAHPLGTLAALIDPHAGHPGRSAFQHLRVLARTSGIDDARVREVLDLVGLGDVAGRRIGRFSLGMSQRLGVAATLLGDPATVMFDEPINGLDPDGIRWMRTLVRQLAAEGRAVLISSHLMSEMALTADRAVVIGQGRLIADETVGALVERCTPRGVLVRTPRAAELSALVHRAGGRLSPRDDELLHVEGLTAAAVGDLAAAHGISLHELVPLRASLEEAFMALTAQSVDFRGQAASRPAEAVAR